LKIFKQSLTFIFQSSFDFKKSIAITIAFEKQFRINQALV